MLDDGITERPDCVSLLGLDHRRLDSVLADAKRWLASGDLQRASVRFSAFRKGLEHHIVAEEGSCSPRSRRLPAPPEAGPPASCAWSTPRSGGSWRRWP